MRAPRAPLSAQRSAGSRKVSANPSSIVRASTSLAQRSVGEREGERENERKLLSSSLIFVFCGTRGTDYKISASMQRRLLQLPLLKKRVRGKLKL